MNNTCDNSLPTPSRGSRIVQLDVLRGIAILLVLVHHTPIQPTDTNFVNRFAECVIRFGWAGVDLFFVLSGFLVGGQLLLEIKKTGFLKMRRFLMRRAFKIWPSYFVFLAFFTYKYSRHASSINEVFRNLWPNFLHVQNYFLTPARFTWSLAVEEHFYLLLPLLLLFLIAKRGRSMLHRIPYIAGGLLILCLAIRSAWFGSIPTEVVEWRRFSTQARIDGLFLGVALAYLSYFRTKSLDWADSHRWKLLAAAIMLIAPVFILNDNKSFVFTVGFTLLSCACGLLLVCLLDRGDRHPLPMLLERNPLCILLARIGIYSYSIYLWHIELGFVPVHNWMKALWNRGPESLHWIWFLALYVPLAVAAGTLMNRIVETPFLWLRDRLLPRPVPLSVVTEAAEYHLGERQIDALLAEDGAGKTQSTPAAAEA